MVFTPEDLLKLLLAVFVGGLIGAEREFRDKAAGFRTLIFICTGAALFTILSMKVGVGGDEARIAAQIVSGVGFLGAGAMLRDVGGRVAGLTTASTIWLSAALGMGVGSGYYLVTLAATGLILLVLWVFPKIEEWIDNARVVRIYEVVFQMGTGQHEHMEGLFRECGLRVRSQRQVKAGGRVTVTWEARGATGNHERAMQALFSDPEVVEFRF